MRVVGINLIQWRVVPIIGRSGRSIPAAGCDARDNEVQSQKPRRPEGFLPSKTIWPLSFATKNYVFYRRHTDS